MNFSRKNEMTHATYAFLLRIENAEISDPEIARELGNTFYDRFNHRLDENNWYQEEAVVLRSGRVINLCPEDDYRGRTALFEELSKIPQEQRWEHARLVALGCVANEFELGGRSRYDFGEPEPEPDYSKSFDALTERILSEMPDRLAQLWQRGPLLGTDVYVDRWRRARWGEEMSRFLESISWGHPPFADSGTPYDYRAFNLADDPEKANVILFVDIHT